MNGDHSFHPAMTLDEEANDDVDFLEPEDDPEDMCWQSEEQRTEMSISDLNGETPQATDWEEAEQCGDLRMIDVTIDKARRQLWKQARAEMGVLRKSWKKDHPTFDELATIVFGPRSRLCHPMSEELDSSCETFCRFLATFCSASIFSVPAPMLFETEQFDATGLMADKNECLDVHRSVDSVGHGRDDTLWMAAEDCFNNLMKKVFLSERGNEELSVALDDDKHHFDFTKNSDTHGLARCRHAEDNRWGHACHTAGLSAAGLPLCASFQREQESSTEKHAKMMKDMLGRRTGEAAPNPQGITLHSDRGCWTLPLAFEKLLPWGADLAGTVARTPWCPFTFSKRPTGDEDPHGRFIVPMKGCKDAHCRTLKWRNRTIRATACKSGTGTAASLAMSAVHHCPVFDLNMAFPKDCRHHFDENQSQDSRDARAFSIIAGSATHAGLIHGLPVHPLTTVQGDTCWFIMRQFSLTSSTVDGMITARAMEIIPSMDERESCETVPAIVGRTNLLPDEPPSSAETSNENGNDESTIDFDGNNEAFDWIWRVNGSDEGAAEFLAALPSMAEETIRDVVARHKRSDPSKNIATLRKQLVKWVDCDSALCRKHHWCNKQQLFQRLKEKDPRMKSSAQSKNKAAILDLLVEAEKQQERRDSMARDGEALPKDEVDPVMLKGFQAWHMKKLKEEAKKCCRQGHAMEKPFLEEFHRHSSQDGITCGHKSLAIFDSPLVASSSITGALDSSDAELVYEKADGTIDTMPIELKARLSHTVFHGERDRLESNLGLKAWENGEPVCVELDADGDVFNKWIPRKKESFQLMHHVAVRNKRKGLTVIGNCKKIVFGVFVNCSNETIEAHRSVLVDLCGRVLDVLCDPSLRLPAKKIGRIMASDEMKPIGLSQHSFLTSHCIWKRLRVDECLPLPLPPCNRMLPCNHSHWNNQKGASDTATKLFWNCRPMTASWGKSQTVVVSKCFQLFSVVLHRMHQVATAKTDLTFCASIHHCRNARNRHEPHHKTLDRLRKCLSGQAEDAVAAALLPVAGGDPAIAVGNLRNAMTPPRAVRSNPRAPFKENRNHLTHTGGTPKRGRSFAGRNRNAAHDQDQRRLKNCPGIVWKTTVGKKCCICGADTSFACAGCKRWHCMASRDKELTCMIADGNEKVAFLNGNRPPSKPAMNHTKDGSQEEFFTAENGCHHIVHRQQISKAIAGMLSLPPVSESENSPPSASGRSC